MRREEKGRTMIARKKKTPPGLAKRKERRSRYERGEEKEGELLPTPIQGKRGKGKGGGRKEASSFLRKGHCRQGNRGEGGGRIIKGGRKKRRSHGASSTWSLF